MKLEPGEYTCPKCSGSGKLYESHTHNYNSNHAPAHNHNNGQSYAVETICNRCCGSGKIDWVQKAMGEQKNNNPLFHPGGGHTHVATMPNDAISFNVNNGDEMLKIAKDGFYVDGEKLDDPHDVYNRFNQWLVSAGF